ncbi:hypothetical protein NUACC21_79830 [Scytonema sp. NUACC21]
MFLKNLEQSLSSNDLSKEKIREISESLLSFEINIMKAKEKYGTLIKKYLDKNNPFPSQPKNFATDCKQYLDLISYCIIIDPDHSQNFLKTWGVDLPLGKGKSLLAESVSEYIDAFTKCRDDKKLFEQLTFDRESNNSLDHNLFKPYFGYLVEQLKQYKSK